MVFQINININNKAAPPYPLAYGLKGTTQKHHRHTELCFTAAGFPGARLSTPFPYSVSNSLPNVSSCGLFVCSHLGGRKPPLSRNCPRRPWARGTWKGFVALVMEDAGQKKALMIAARETGPGPGCYSLPPAVGFANHDYTRFTSPAYSFHQRLDNSIHLKDSSPGPCYYVEPELTRFGRAKGPSYSMLARAKPPGLPQTPGPGAYSPERAPPLSQHRPPSFSMGARTKSRRVDPAPAPNSYVLPSLLGPNVPSKSSSPSFTISGWNARGSYAEDLCRTPGPGRYNTTDPGIYLCRPPAFSMLGRLKPPAAIFHTPGPGAHSPEKVTAHRSRAPSYSLGVRHSEYLMPLVVDALER
ncbi:protein CIMAP1D [Elgaria multicarinata webbii]|uniref:protein CIMAP1D n=1 Tax=Elgaria multicarinata webbii TaxID=159646 RepID=UPI002FCD3797